MLPRRGGFAGHGAAPRLAGIAAPFLMLAALACGVPLSASEITATAERDSVLGVTVSTQTSSRSSATATGQVVASPAASPAATATLPVATPTPTPESAVLSAGDSATVTTTPTPGTPTATATPSATPTPTPSPAELAAQVIKLLNDQRATRGLPALKANSTLATAAAGYARLMAERNWFGHDGPDGSSPQSRVRASGYAGSFKGETLAAGQISSQAALNAWITSPAHVAIVFAPDAVDVGVGYFYRAGSPYGAYWVLVTGIP